MLSYSCLACGTEHTYRGKNYASKFCNVKCQMQYQYSKYIDKWKAGLVDGRKGKLQTSGHIRRYILEKQKYKCDTCGITDYNNVPITLELDHVNGNSLDNSEGNLRCLCPNCHSQTNTYRSKNKGKGRADRIVKPLYP